MDMLAINDFVSVHDHGAFAAEHLPNLGHDVKDFQVYTWKLTNWKKLERKITSPEFDCGGHKWRILLFPFGNSNAPPNDTVSVYLDYAEPKKFPEGWHACAQFALVISNIHDPTTYIVSHAYHRFTAEQCDWGFTRFSELRKLFNIQDRHLRPIIEEESADVSVYIRVLEDPTGVLWHNFVNYDSKKQTGYVGLKNQGATGYMNCVLQSLYCIPYFRKAIYRIPTEDEHPTESVSLALQRLFYRLQTSDQPVCTTELTKSFGWKSCDSFYQHDALEFHHVLQDNLESKMKGTQADGAIAKLFVGKIRSYIKCINVDYESSRTEEFKDIQLKVKGMKNLYKSFRNYVAEETMEGENQYPAEGFGLQDAKKGVIFESFPPVLHVQLEGFEYGSQRDVMVKINDRYEFPLEIDLVEFIDKASLVRSESWLYRLYGVWVHSGDITGGRYFALIKPDREAGWLKFDDDRVTPVTDCEVLEENYGGKPLDDRLYPMQRNQIRGVTSAYILVYVRDAMIDDVLAPLKEEDIPTHLKRGLDEERLQLEAKRKEREEQHLFLTARVITDDTFARYEGFDLATFNDKNWPQSELPTFRVLKQEPYSVFKSQVAARFRLPDNKVRLWVLVNRQNRTVRPDAPIPENEPSLTVEVIRNSMAARQSDLRLYLDVLTNPSKPDPPPGYIMVFLKHFDTSKQTLYGVGKLFVSRNSKVQDLHPLINERMKWTPGTPLRLYEEIKPGMIELMKPKLTFAQSETQDGDIICFQIEQAEKKLHDLETQGLYSNPIHFYDFLQNRVMISFRPKLGEPGSDHPEFHLVLSKKHNYDTMSQRVGEHLRHDPIKLRFTSTHVANGAPKAILKRSLNQSIADIMGSSYVNPTTAVILYEKLDVSIVELETKRSLKIIWTGIHNREEASYPFLLPKTSMIYDLANHLAKVVSLTPGGTGKIRVFEISKDGKTQKEFTGSEMIGNIPDPVDLYAEEIPREEFEASASDIPAQAAQRSGPDLCKAWTKDAPVRIPRGPRHKHGAAEDREGLGREEVEEGRRRVVDAVVEAIKRDKNLDPQEERLLGCITDPNSISTTLAHVHLPQHTIDSIRIVVSLPLLYPTAFQTGILRDHTMTGCLLFGPPGTGKTLIVQALVKEAGSRMLMVSSSDVMDMYAGEGEKLVRATFSLARRLSPCIVFLDEIDALFSARTSVHNSGGVTMHRGVITEFIQEMDRLKSRADKERVIVVGATNRPFDLDSAVLRRLPKRLLVDLPGEKEREGILKILLRDETLSPDLDLSSLAKQTESFSGLDLKELCISAALVAVKESVTLPWNTPLDSTSVTAKGHQPPNLSDTEAPSLSYSRVIHSRHFTKAFTEITPSSSEFPGLLADLRKWNEQFGEGRKDKRHLQV